MNLTVNRIYKNSDGVEIRVDEIEMVPKSNELTLMYYDYEHKHISYARKVSTTILDVVVNMTIATIDLIGNYTSRDTTSEKDWCTWELPLDIVESGVRQTKTIRCNMSDLKNIGDSAL